MYVGFAINVIQTAKARILISLLMWYRSRKYMHIEIASCSSWTRKNTFGVILDTLINVTYIDNFPSLIIHHSSSWLQHPWNGRKVSNDFPTLNIPVNNNIKRSTTQVTQVVIHCVIVTWCKLKLTVTQVKERLTSCDAELTKDRYVQLDILKR